MTIVIGFRCGNCGYGPLDVDDNREAPIPNPPISIFDPEGEGLSISSCPRCDAELPEFWHPAKPLSKAKDPREPISGPDSKATVA